MHARVGNFCSHTGAHVQPGRAYAMPKVVDCGGEVRGDDGRARDLQEAVE